MERSELEHLLRAAGEIIGEQQFIVIGSQSILGKFPEAPEQLLRSREADFIAKNKPESTRMLEAIGEASRFYETYGYYVDPVDSRTAVLPKDWKSRLVNLSSPSTKGVTGLCLDPHDLFISKVAAWRDKDIEFVKVMLEHRMVDQHRLLALAAKVPHPEDDLGRAARIKSRIERLYADRDRNP